MIKCSLLSFLLLISFFNFGQTKKLHRNISNGIDEEIAPKISADGNAMAFLYKPNRGGAWKIYYSRKKTGKWGRSSELMTINKQSNLIQFGGFTLNEDGSIIYFSSKKYGGVGGYDLWKSSRIDDLQWTTPVNLFKPINTVGNECSPSISSDGNYMYFTRCNVVNASSSSCCEIYVSDRRGKGWGDAIASPAPINLVCESSPFIHPDGKTLYFASNRKGGKGKLDIYISQKIEENIWTKPQALEFFNTVNDDQFITMDAREHVMYYADKSDETFDLYATILEEKYRAEPLLKIRLRLIDEEGNRVGGYLRIKHPGSSANLFVKKISSEVYQSNIYLSGKGDHDFTVYGADDNHFFFSEEFNMDSLDKYRYVKRQIVLQTIKRGGMYPVDIVVEQDTLLSAFEKEELQRIKRVVFKHDDKSFSLEIASKVFPNELVTDTIYLNKGDSLDVEDLSNMQVVERELFSREEVLVMKKMNALRAYCNSIGLSDKRMVIVLKEEGEGVTKVSLLID